MIDMARTGHIHHHSISARIARIEAPGRTGKEVPLFSSRGSQRSKRVARPDAIIVIRRHPSEIGLESNACLERCMLLLRGFADCDAITPLLLPLPQRPGPLYVCEGGQQQTEEKRGLRLSSP